MTTERKGITPVVAIVLLLLLTIAAAGAAFAFSQNLVGQKIEEGEQRANSELTIKDIICKDVAANKEAPNGFNASKITLKAKNTGNVDLDNGKLFMYWVANGSLMTQNTTGMHNWAADTFQTRTYAVGKNVSSGVPYKVEIQFDNNYKTSGQCEP